MNNLTKYKIIDFNGFLCDNELYTIENKDGERFPAQHPNYSFRNGARRTYSLNKGDIVWVQETKKGDNTQFDILIKAAELNIGKNQVAVSNTSKQR